MLEYFLHEPKNEIAEKNERLIAKKNMDGRKSIELK